MHTIPEHYEWLAVAPMGWARHIDREKCIRLALQNVPQLYVKPSYDNMVPVILYRVPPGTEVNGMGGITWEASSEEVAGKVEKIYVTDTVRRRLPRQ